MITIKGNQIRVEIKNCDYFNNNKMPKNQKKQPTYCSKHQFSLIPIQNDTYFKQPITHSFSKRKQQIKGRGRQKKNRTYQDCLCCPVYNKDKNFATSSFILPEQQQNFIENFNKLKLEHENKVQEYNDQKSQLLIPKPKSRYSYCNVCCVNYTDYLDHIQDVTHKNNINKSKYHRYIRDLQKKYEGVNRPQKNKQKSSQIITISNSNSHTQLEVQEISKPQKRVKMSPQYNQLCNSSRFISTCFQTQQIPNFYYPNFYYPSMPIYPPMNSSYPNFGYLMQFGLVGNPFMCWNSNGMVPNMSLNYNNQNHSNFRSCKPAFVDLDPSEV